MDQNSSPSQPDRLPWYAIRVKSKLANVAAETLAGKGYDQFHPLYRSRRRWSDRVKVVELPLFPGYLFCRLNVNDRLMPLLTTPGVIAIVGAGKTPVPVEEHTIEAIRSILRSGLTVQPWPALRAGSRVRIECGPLQGLEGVITSVEKVCRLVVSVHLLQRSVAVEIDREWARPIGPAKIPA